MVYQMKQKVVENWKRLVYGEVYVPYRIDTDLEFATPEEIEKAAHYFMAQSNTHNVDSEHNFKQADNIVVQSYIAKENDPDGFVPGSWIAVGQIKDDAQWELVKSGKLNGWSMAGRSDKVPRTVKVTALVSATLKTDESIKEGVENHVHDMILKFNDGKVMPTMTSEVLGHSHEVIATTATEEANGHSHRFNLDWSNDSPDIQKEEKEIPAVELVNIQPDWLSLVEHAATRRAFKMVKCEEMIKEVSPLDRVVHAIVSDLEFDEVLKLEDLGWLVPSEVHFEERVRIGKSNKYILIPNANFVKGSLKTIDTNKENVKMIAGILKEDAIKNAISVEGVEEMDEAKVLELIEKALSEKLGELVKTEEVAALKDEIAKSVDALKIELVELFTPKIEEVTKSQGDTLGEIKVLIETLQKSQAELVVKHDELSQKAMSMSGAGSNDEVVTKSDSERPSDWFFNHKNPLVQKILAE